jgi:PAP2 superfamily
VSATIISPALERRHPPTSVLESLRAEWQFKLVLYLGLSFAFCAPYFAIERMNWLSPHTLAVTWLDRAIGYHPASIYAYQSVYLLIPLLPFLSASRTELWRFSSGFLLLCGISFTVFLVFPVAGPRPDGAAANWMTQLVYSYDRNVNVFPSLHVAFAAYSILFGYACRREIWLNLGCTSWLVAIMYATVATKQHYMIDLPPALLLSWVSHRWAWRSA